MNVSLLKARDEAQRRLEALLQEAEDSLIGCLAF